MLQQCDVQGQVKFAFSLKHSCFFKNPPGKIPPGKFPPIKFPLENSPLENPPRKFSPGIFPPISLIVFFYLT